MRIPVHLQPGRTDEPSVRAYCPDLPGCSATAPTDTAALAILRDRVAEYFRHGEKEPAPPGTRTITIEL